MTEQKDLRKKEYDKYSKSLRHHKEELTRPTLGAIALICLMSFIIFLVPFFFPSASSDRLGGNILTTGAYTSILSWFPLALGAIFIPRWLYYGEYIEHHVLIRKITVIGILASFAYTVLSMLYFYGTIGLEHTLIAGVPAIFLFVMFSGVLSGEIYNLRLEREFGEVTPPE